MSNLLTASKKFVKRNGSTILTTIGGVGVVTTAVMAVKATPKALYLIEQAEKEKGEKLTKLEVVQETAPVYIPAVLVGIGTVACIIGANVLSKRQQASMMSAYALLDRSYKDYKKKAAELYGKEADSKIKQAIATDKLKEENIQNKEDDGTQLFFDEYSKRFFRATNEQVLGAEYHINKMLSEDGGASLNDFYRLLNIPSMDYGEHIGWSSSQMFEMYWSAWIDFYHQKIEEDDGTVYYIIEATEPTADYMEY